MALPGDSASVAQTLVCQSRRERSRRPRSGPGATDPGHSTSAVSTPRSICSASIIRRGSRIVIVGDFDADGATSTRAGGASDAASRLQTSRLPGAQSLPVRLRPDAGDRAARGRREARADRHGRQRHLQSCWRGRGHVFGHRNIDHRSSPRARDGAGCERHRESERAGRYVSQAKRSPVSAWRFI